MEVANIEANYSMGYFNSIGNGFGKIMNVDHINRHEILDNNNRMVIYCNEKTKNRYLNCFKKNQIFIRYQAKIANKRHELNGEGMKVSGTVITVNQHEIKIKATTFCVHSDTSNAIEIVKELNKLNI